MEAAAKATNKRAQGALKNFSAQKGWGSVLPKEYQTIFKNTGKPMVIVEEDATISLANDEFEKLSGYKREEIEGKKSWTEFVARNDRKRVKEYHHLRRSDPMLAPRCFEFRFLDRHGTVKNIVLTIGTIPGTQKSMASLQDVTDRRRAEASLRVREERYHTLFENSRDAFYITTSDGAYIDANQAALDMFGYTREQMRKVNARQLYADHADAQRFQQEIKEKGFVRDFEVKLRKKDGTVMDCLFTVTAQRADDGGILEYQGIVRDITERKRMEETLKESEERYRTLVDNVDFGINFIDADHNIVMVNAAGTKQIGKPVSELVGKKCFREFEKRDALCPHCPGVRTMATGKLAEVESEGVRDDGSRHNVRIQTFPAFGHDGTMTGFIEVVEDITERKQAEELLQQEKETFSTILQYALYGVGLIDRDGTYLYVNPEFTKITGYTLEDIPTGRDWMHKAFPDKEYRQKVIEAWKKDCGSEGMISREFRVVCKDGETKEIEFRPAQLINGRAIVMLADVTERRQMEEELRESEERFKMLAEDAPFGISIMVPDRSFEYLNPRFTEIFGYTMEDIPDKDTWFKKAYPDKTYRNKVISTWKRDITEAVKIGKENLRVFTVRCKDGQDKIIDFRSVDLKDGKQYLVYEDNTVRAKAEEALKQSEERYRALVENVNLGINLIDADHTILSVNAGQGSHFGKPRSETIGKKCYQEFEKRDAVCPHCPGVQTLVTGQPAEAETEGIRDDGSRFNARLQTFPIFGDDGTVTSFIEVVEDITERKQAEELLQQEKETFYTILQHALYGVALMEADGKHVYVNPEFTAITGYTLEDIPTGRDWMHKAYPDKKYRQEVTKCWRKDSKLGGTKREVSIVCKGGERKEIETSRTPLENGLSVVMLSDITERKQMEDELRKSEERFRLLVEHSKDALLLHDFDGKIIDVNQHACESLGYTREELLNLSIQDIDDDVLPGKHQEQWKQIVPGHPITLEGVHRRKDGTTFPVEVRLGVFESGGRKLILGLVRDVTERKQMEEELRESEERHRRLIETTKVGVSAIDEKGVIIYANERFCEIWGYSVDEIMGRHVFDFLDEENLKILKEQLSKRRKGSRELYEITWTRKDGSKAPTILSPTPIIDADGRYKGSYGFITDITERKRMEDQLKRYAAELEQSNEEVKNFAYIVSHDLRVPLVNLKGYTSELHSALEIVAPAMEIVLPHLNEDKRSAVAMALHEDVPEALEFITNSVSRMDSFINSVLILSRLGRRELKPEPIDMNALVQMSLENLSHQIQERGATVTVGSLPQVVADRTAMEQIMGNILGNAVKYLDPERTGQIEVTAQTNNGEQFFLIRDNGRGIAQEDMHKVFAPFRRAGKQDTQGEGMGLAYVQTLIRRLNGRIWCESELGKGTTFTFSISQLRAERRDYVSH